jgi:hypothetical protein
MLGKPLLEGGVSIGKQNSISENDLIEIQKDKR